MSTIDKFGRPLPQESLGAGKSLPVLEGMRLDSDKNYTALKKRIKMVADPEEESDAVNLSWLNNRLYELEKRVEANIERSRETLLTEMSSKDQMKILEVPETTPSAQDEYSIVTDPIVGIKGVTEGRPDSVSR